jgi:anti-sigma regulatory factor (Ser/Thr protein kinase)
MTGATVRETVTLAGRAERARVARAFVAAVLGPGHPCAEDAVLLVSEIFGNSVRHSRSGAPGETVTVAVRAGDGVVRVEVTDRSGPGVPELDSSSRDEEGGRGLQLVAGRAARWGGVGAAGGRLRGSSCRTADLRPLPATPVLATPGSVWGNEILTKLGMGSNPRSAQAMASSCQGGPI